MLPAPHNLFRFDSSWLNCFGAFSADVMSRLTNATYAHAFPLAIPSRSTLTPGHLCTPSPWPRPIPSMLPPPCTVSLASLPSLLHGEHRRQRDGRRRDSSFCETTMQHALGESLVGLKLLPWKQGRLEEVVEVVVLSVVVNWFPCNCHVLSWICTFFCLTFISTGL